MDATIVARRAQDDPSAAAGPREQELARRLDVTGQRLAEVEAKLRRAEADLALERAAHAKITAEHEAVLAARTAPERLASERLHEIVTLTCLLREQERFAAAAVQEMNDRCADAYDLMASRLDQRTAGAEREDRRRQWLRAVLAEALRAGSRRGPSLAARLERAGLFDAAAYRARHKDVAQAGIDPLVHYVMHGMDEGRLDV